MKIRFLKPFSSYAIYGFDSGDDSFVGPFNVKKGEVFNVDAQNSQLTIPNEDVMLGVKLKFIPQEIWEVI